MECDFLVRLFNSSSDDVSEIQKRVEDRSLVQMLSDSFFKGWLTDSLLCVSMFVLCFMRVHINL